MSKFFFSLIINDCLETGTQLPYIRKARSLGYGVIVMNTNDNYRIHNGKKCPIEVMDIIDLII